MEVVMTEEEQAETASERAVETEVPRVPVTSQAEPVPEVSQAETLPVVTETPRAAPTPSTSATQPSDVNLVHRLTIPSHIQR